MIPLPLIAGIIGGIILIVILASGYVKAKPDEAILISGYKKKPRIITGTATIKIPFLERRDSLTLKVIKVDVKTERPVPTNEFIDISVDSVVTIKISSDPELIIKASQNFLNQKEDYIMNMVTDVLEGNIREIIGTMTLREMISDRQEFAKRVEENAVPDMAKMGIEIVSFNVQNFWDENGIIEALGVENTAKIKMEAQIVRAGADRDVKVAQARANKASNDEEVKSKQEIAEKQHELNIKTAQLKKAADTQSAEADAAYDIQKENQRKTIEIATADANLARQEKEIELQKREVQIEEQRLDGLIKKKAEADRYARGQVADADLYETQKRAEARIAQAKAERQEREEYAIGVRAVALAEADGIRAKALAEAEGIDKKAEAMAKMEKAAILEMYFNTLPEIAKYAATTLDNVDNLTVYGTDGASKLAESSTKIIAQLSNGLSDSLGLDLGSIVSGLLGGTMASKVGTKSNEATKSTDKTIITEVETDNDPKDNRL